MFSGEHGRGRKTSGFLLIFFLISFPFIVESGEWLTLQIGVSKAEDAKKILGLPLQELPDYLLFSGEKIQSKLKADTVVVNLDSNKTIESIFLFPIFGTTEIDTRKFFGGGGKIMTYEEFLTSTGRNSYGAGTRASQKLHYVPLSSECELYENLRALVIYEDRDFSSGNAQVKLVIFY